MKRILYVGNKLSRHGNTITAMEILGPLLQREGYEVAYASSKKNKALRLLDMWAKTIYYSAKLDYMLIDTYSTSNFWYVFSVSQLGRILGVKYIPVLHGGNLPKRLQSNPILCRMIFDHALTNVAPSGYLLDVFQKTGFSNTVFIPNTIEIKNYTFKSRIQLNPKLLWVRSFSPIYNPAMALNVLALLKKDFADASLCMVGPDKNGYLETIKAYANRQNLDVTFTGKLSKKEWATLSESYDIFINTTHFDNTPVSVIEAMALGLPIVSTNVGGIPFLLEDHKTALLVADGDVEAMVNAIKKMLKEETLTRMLTENAFQLTQTFDFENVKHQWLEILK